MFVLYAFLSGFIGSRAIIEAVDGNWPAAVYLMVSAVYLGYVWVRDVSAQKSKTS